ncbi:hypothetical protein OG21DRAFT_1407357, partial [Imleria badia]
YFVVAPDFLGHGNTRRSSEYTITVLAPAPLYGSQRQRSPVLCRRTVARRRRFCLASSFLLKSTRPVLGPPLE